jgi:hypothetical protein
MRSGVGGGASEILTLWKSPILINETGEGASEQTPHSFGEAARDSRKRHCTSSKKTCVSLDKPSASLGKKVTDKDLSKKRFVTFYSSLCFKLLNFPLMARIVIFQNLRIFSNRTRCPNSRNTIGIMRQRPLYLEELLANA